MMKILVVLAIICITTTINIPYTEKIEEFKDEFYNARTQLMLGCWLYVNQYLLQHQMGKLTEEKLFMVKECMRNITRKIAVLKITSLAHKNIQPVKDLQSFIDMDTLVKHHPNAQSMSEFDVFLFQMLQKYEQELGELQQKGDIKEQVETELSKRRGYFLGVIPISEWTYSIVLLCIAVTLTCCCTLYKYYGSEKERNQKKVEDKKKKRKQQEDKRAEIKKKYQEVKEMMIPMKKNQ